jgi:peptide/nickel transport system substrate-binding protein
MSAPSDQETAMHQTSPHTARRRRRRLAVLAAVGLAALAGTMCATASSKSSPTLIWAKSFDIKSIDPAHQHEVTGGIVDSLLYDTLTTFSGSKNGQPLPLVASKVSTSRDHRTFFFTLRKDVKFSDGTPLTSKDVVFSFLRLKYGGGVPAYEMNGLNVYAKGPYKVGIQSAQPQPGVPSLVASSYFSILNSKVVMAHGGNDNTNANTTDTAQGYLDKTSAGSGPYTLVQYTPQQSVILKANPNYWGGKPKFTQIVLKNVPAATQLQEVQKGTSNLAVDLSPNQVASAGSSVHVTTHASSTFFFLEGNMNPAVGAAANKSIQKAISLAIDYKNIVSLVGKGAAPIAGFIPSVLPGALDPKFGFQTNLAKAKALVAASGISNPTVNLEYPNDFFLNGLAFGTIAQRLQSQIQAVGITVNLTPGPLATTLANWRAGTEQLGLWTTTPDYPAPYVNLDFCPGGNHALRVKWAAGADPALEKLCAQAAQTTLTDPNFSKIFTAVQRKLLADGPYFPLFQPSQVIVTSKSIGNVQYSPTTFVDVRQLTHT